MAGRRYSGLFLFVSALAFSALSSFGLNVPSREPIYGYGFSNVFPGITFDRPVVIATAPGETNRLFVAEKGGRIYAITNFASPSASLFLDLSYSTFTSTEAGLLGLAFHPRFQENGRFFTFRVTNSNGYRDLLSEFRVDPLHPEVASPAERAIISQRDLSDTHNAGDLKFGPDGYLYLSLGYDGPTFPDTRTSPQAIDKGFFSGVIRIDVDERPENLPPNPHPAIVGAYRVPRDNPFVGATKFNGSPVDPAGLRTEFWAVGMRNPWRFNFDPYTGELILADVGEGTVEEINVITRGGNYGWPYMEGPLTRIEEKVPSNLLLPRYSYFHGTGADKGTVVIGGVGYSGTEYPELDGRYLFTDYSSGNVWSVDLHAAEPKPVWIAGRTGISTFARHPADGGVLVANHMSGRIERLVYQRQEDAVVPRTLAEVGAFSDLTRLTVASKFVPFEVNAPLWSDGAIKQRWVDLSKAAGNIKFRESGAWEFPEGMAWVKHFELELTNGFANSRRRVETRVLVKTADDVYGLTYRWGGSFTNAVLVPPEGATDSFVIHDGGTVRTQVWNYPSWDQCRACHNKETGYILGFRTHQLNRTVTNTSSGEVINQLERFVGLGVFEKETTIDASSLLSLVPLTDPSAPAQFRVRSYFEGNCLQCHIPKNGRSGAVWDARIETPLKEANLIGHSALFYPAPAKILDPHNLENSYLYSRVSNRTPLFQMPPFATTEVDQDCLNALAQWIQRMPAEEWETVDIGPHLAEGAMEVDGNTYTVFSTARGVSRQSYFFSGRAAFGSTEFSARLRGIRSATSGAEAGLMLRENLNENARAVTFFRRGDSLVFAIKTNAWPGFMVVRSIPAFAGSRLKLIANGHAVSAWVTGERIDWRQVAATDFSFGPSYFAGFIAASNGEGVQFAAADFTDVEIASIHLENENGTDYLLPAIIPVAARASAFGTTEPAVTFFASGLEIGTATNAPWKVSWLNPAEGDATLEAVLRGASGGAVTSAPVSLHLTGPPSEIWLKPLDLRTRGDWNTSYGSEAYLIPAVTNSVSDKVLLQVLNGTPHFVSEATNASALVLNSRRVKSELASPDFVKISLTALDYASHQSALYFRDWSNAGLTQTVTFLDARSGAVVSRTSVSAKGGVYLPFVFKNSVAIEIKNSEGDSYLTGVFVDPLSTIGIFLSSPQDGATLEQPAAVQLRIETDGSVEDLDSIQVRDGESAVLVNGASAQVVLTNLLSGDHTIFARALSRYGVTSDSEPIQLKVLPAETRAEFLGIDGTSGGDWIGRYGKAGYWIVGADKSLPGTFGIDSPDGLLWSFTAGTTNLSALELPGADVRIANCLFGEEFSLNVDARDGRACTVALYVLDWGDSQRDMDLLVTDPDGKVLDTRRVNRFGDGIYYLWRVQGQPRFRFKSRSVNAVVSAIFVDAPLQPYDLWLKQRFSPAELRLDVGTLGAQDSDGDGVNNLLEYFLGSDPKSAADKPDFSLRLSAGWLQISFTQRATPPDLELVFETSNDLKNWQVVTPVAITQQVAGGVHRSFSFPLQTGSRFIRYSLRATRS